MFALERIKLIKKYLNENQKAEVTALSGLLDVSEVTIRRDLEKLEKEGFLQRIHGGAVLTDELTESHSGSIQEADDPLLQNRMEIGDIASNLVDDRDVIMLTPGLTNLQLARHLKNRKNLTVLTNDLLIALEFSGIASIKVIILGGDLDSQSRGVYGKFTIDSIRSFFVNKTFFEVEGINQDSSLTVSSIEKATLIQEAVKIAGESICLCPGNCFGKKAFYPVGDVSMAGKIISDSSMGDEYKKMFFQQNIQIFTSLQMYEGHV